MDEMVQVAQKWLNDTYTGRYGYNVIDADGVTGWSTMYALTRALQIELGLAEPSDNFGTGTLTALANYGNISKTANNSNANIVKIIQSALYCKGYGPGGITGTFGDGTDKQITIMKTQIGLTNADGVVTPKVFKALLTMDAYVITGDGTEKVRSIQQWLNGRYYNRSSYYFQPCDGNYSRSTQKALIFAIQYEEGLSDSVATGTFGSTTKANLPTLKLGSADSTTQFVHLLQAALCFNGEDTPFTGTFDETTKTSVVNFQSFTKLSADGIVGKQTWSSLLVSTGDPTRRGSACDCVTSITSELANTLKSENYKTVGRYLTNVEGSSLNKKLQEGELQTILNAGLTVFPIFQTYGGEASYFNKSQGASDVISAYHAARFYGFPKDTVIYFAVDYDAMENEITSNILPHFQGINEKMQELDGYYRIGVYGTRNVCTKVSNKGYAVYSFLSDMSTGYSGNLGFAMPKNWAFDQISTITVGTSPYSITIDNDIKSGLDDGCSQIAASINIPTYLNEVNLPDSLKESLKPEAVAYMEDEFGTIADLKSVRSVSDAFQIVMDYDELLTTLSNRYKMRKALIQVPFFRETSFEGLDDTLADAAVINYYTYMEAYEIWSNLPLLEQALTPCPTMPILVKEDCSTGYCQIFASTAIDAYNYAFDQGIVTDEKYDKDDWKDVWKMWQQLHSDAEFNINMAALVLMRCANQVGVSNHYYEYTQSDLEKVIARYNGTNEGAAQYGRTGYVCYSIFETYNKQARENQ